MAAEAEIPIRLKKVDRHAGTILSRAPLPLKVETDPQQWSYAISVRLARAEHATLVQHLPIAVFARVTVESGTLGCLLVEDDWRSLLGRSTPTLGVGTHTVVLVWERSGQGANLAFRNDADNGPCVFTVESVHLLTRPDPLRHLLQVHNGAQRVGDELEFLSDPTQWGYSVSFPLNVPPPPDPNLRPVIVVEAHVLQGMIGVGVLDTDFGQFISSEADVGVTERSTRIELPIDVAAGIVHVIVRNTAPHSHPSRFRLLSTALEFTTKDQRLFVPRGSPEVPVHVHASPSLTGTFDLLVSLSSRHWDAGQCDRAYLAERYARPQRLSDPPDFETLPPNVAPYHGLLSVFRLDLCPSGLTGRVLGHYDSREKIQHACLVGNDVVVCFDAGVAVCARADVDRVELLPETADRVVDPWFGGLHTVMPVDGRTCLVSSSGADAVLWLDVPTRKVVRRWRLPASRYGFNYALDDTTWLSEHYVSNDLQLGHLNCAVPDGGDGVFCSVLGQGDIGHVDAAGHFDLLVSGFVGCHGIRYDRVADLLYFSDSCSGRLMRVDGHDRTTVLFDTGSRWLHDALHLRDGLFVLVLGDTNRLLLVDTGAGRLLAEWDFRLAGGTVQFLNPAPALRGEPG